MSERTFYTGIGSRKTPREVLDAMEVIARHLANRGLVLRSGGADAYPEADIVWVYDTDDLEEALADYYGWGTQC